MQFSFWKPHFWHPSNFAKTLFWHTVALFVFLKMPKKHYKTGEKQQKQIGPVLTLDLDQFLTLETPNLGPVFNSTAYIYMYGTHLSWRAIFVKNVTFPPISSKRTQTVNHVSMFLMFLIFAFLCPSLSFFLCFFTSQSLNCTHQLRCATCIYIYIRIYIYIERYSSRFSFAFAFVMIMLDMHKHQQQAALTKKN